MYVFKENDIIERHKIYLEFNGYSPILSSVSRRKTVTGIYTG